MKKTIENIVNETKGKQGVPNSIVYTFIALLLAVDFLTDSTAIDILYPQYFYLAGLNLVFAVYFYFNKQTLSANMLHLFRKSYIFWAYLAFIIINGLTFITAKNNTLVLEKFVELVIGFCLFVNFTILLRNKLHLIYSIVFIICISAFFQSAIELYYLKQKASNTSILTALSFMAERTGNINILAASLTIKIPFLLIGITHFKTSKKIFLYISLLLVTTVIFLTAARTAIINISLIYILFTIYFLKKHSFGKTYLVTSFTFIIPAILSIAIVNMIFEKSKDNSRYVSLKDRIQQINAKDASVNTRLLFWENTIQLIKKQPIVGIGLGNYKIESIPYEKTQLDDSNISLHSHNDFLEITAETGILNGLLYISIFAFIIFINSKRALRSGNEETHTIAILTLMVSIAYIVDSLLNFPMFRPTMLIFFALSLVLTVLNKPALGINSETKITGILTIPLLVTSLIAIYFAFLGYKSSSLEYKIKKDSANSFATNLLTGDELIKELPKFKNTLSTAEPFYEQAAIYYIHEKKYDEALKYLSKADKINPNFGRVFYHKMIISNAKGNLDSAYIYAKQAFYMRPRNLNFFKMSIQFARTKNDTIEILKEHETFNTYRKIPQSWSIAAEELKKTNFKRNNLVGFINKGLKEFPTDSILLKEKANIKSSAYLEEANSFRTKNNLVKTLEFYLKALEADPKNAEVLQNLAFYYYNKSNYKQSVAYFLKALDIEELNSGRTEFFIANCYLQMKDISNACKYFSISTSKRFPDAQKQLLLNCK